jgi:hypothetical protein
VWDSKKHRRAKEDPRSAERVSEGNRRLEDPLRRADFYRFDVSTVSPQNLPVSLQSFGDLSIYRSIEARGWIAEGFPCIKTGSMLIRANCGNKGRGRASDSLRTREISCLSRVNRVSVIR